MPWLRYNLRLTQGCVRQHSLVGAQALKTLRATQKKQLSLALKAVKQCKQVIKPKTAKKRAGAHSSTLSSHMRSHLGAKKITRLNLTEN